jgi:hypothetical protein
MEVILQPRQFESKKWRVRLCNPKKARALRVRKFDHFLPAYVFAKHIATFNDIPLKIYDRYFCRTQEKHVIHWLETLDNPDF